VDRPKSRGNDTLPLRGHVRPAVYLRSASILRH
jgi:hypothetical protein